MTPTLRPTRSTRKTPQYTFNKRTKKSANSRNAKMSLTHAIALVDKARSDVLHDIHDHIVIKKRDVTREIADWVSEHDRLVEIRDGNVYLKECKGLGQAACDEMARLILAADSAMTQSVITKGKENGVDVSEFEKHSSGILSVKPAKSSEGEENTLTVRPYTLIGPPFGATIIVQCADWSESLEDLHHAALGLARAQMKSMEDDDDQDEDYVHDIRHIKLYMGAKLYLTSSGISVVAFVHDFIVFRDAVKKEEALRTMSTRSTTMNPFLWPPLDVYCIGTIQDHLEEEVDRVTPQIWNNMPRVHWKARFMDLDVRRVYGDSLRQRMIDAKAFVGPSLSHKKQILTVELDEWLMRVKEDRAEMEAEEANEEVEEHLGDKRKRDVIEDPEEELGRSPLRKRVRREEGADVH